MYNDSPEFPGVDYGGDIPANPNVTRLIPTKSDAEVAAELKEKILASSQPVLDALEEAHKKGFQINIGFGMGPLGKMMIGQLVISKVF